MAKYFIYPNASLSQVFAENPANPEKLDIVEIEKLPAPIQYCIYKDGKVFAKDGYLDDLKALQCQKINEVRDTVEQSGFMFNGRLIDSDKDSCLRITISEKAGVATYWTCADNSMIWLEPKDLTLMALALRDHSNHCFEIAHLWKCYVSECEDTKQIEELMAQFNEGVFNAD